MDLKQTSMSPFATIVAAVGFCLCLLNCGCQPTPAGGGASDSQSNQPAKTDAVGLADANASSSKESSKKEPAKNNVKKSKSAPPEPDVNDARFHAAIKAAAEKYLAYAMVNTTAMKIPDKDSTAEEEGFLEDPAAKMSQAESGHGQKLYFLFAKDIAHYSNPNGSKSPVGQALVLESWTAVPGNPDARNLRSHASGNRVNPRVAVGDKTLKLGKRSDLFVMLKQDPGADKGWVYGMIDPKSHEIKSAGAVASCIACHGSEKDSLFRDGIIDWEAEAIKQAEAEAKAAEAKKSKSPADSETDE